MYCKLQSIVWKCSSIKVTHELLRIFFSLEKLMSYLEQQSILYANKNKQRFDKIIKRFARKSQKYTKTECDTIHDEYKAECVATNVIQLSYLFENERDQYKYITTRIINSFTKEDFAEIYREYIGNIHKRLFGKTFDKLKLIPKFEDSDKTVASLLQCVLKRIDYHDNCREHSTKYNVPGHEHELLRSVYMYYKVKEIQTLLNMYIEKYKVVREHINNIALKEKQRVRKEKERLNEELHQIDKELHQIDKELSNFDNLTLETF